MKKQDKVCVLYGGLSSEREVSLKTGENMAEALRKNYENVVLIDAGYDLAERIIEQKPDICVIALHGTYGEDGSVQGLLETMGIRYSGSGVASCAISFDKVLSKGVFMAAGVDVPRFKLLSRNESVAPFIPCVVKPAREGSSVGVSLVFNEDDFIKARDEAFRYDSKVLAEEFIKGKEITVPIFDGEVFPAIWIKPAHEFYDYECKYTKGMTEYLFETGLSQDLQKELEASAVKVYNACECRSVARVDFIVTSDKCYAIEINTLPGMTSTSLVPKSAAKKGMAFEELVGLVAERATLDNKKKDKK